MRQQTRTGPPALDRARGQWGLGEALAAATGEARAQDAVHDIEPWSAIGPRSRHCCATGSSPMAAASGPEPVPVPRSHLRPGGAACRRPGRIPRCRGSVRPRRAEYGPGSVCASACRRVYHPAGAASPSSPRRRSRSFPALTATARTSLRVRRIRNRSGGSISRRTRSDGRVGLPTDACPALALRGFSPSIRPPDGSILLCRTALHSRSAPPGTSLPSAKVL